MLSGYVITLSTLDENLLRCLATIFSGPICLYPRPISCINNERGENSNSDNLCLPEDIDCNSVTADS